LHGHVGLPAVAVVAAVYDRRSAYWIPVANTSAVMDRRYNGRNQSTSFRNDINASP
jgi:hypothetical protein